MVSKRIKYDWGYEWQTDDGTRHRLDGPAAEWNDGSKAWYVDDKLHRLDGPAIEHSDGSKYWYVDGENLTEKEFNKHPLVIKYRNRQLIKDWINGE